MLFCKHQRDGEPLSREARGLSGLVREDACDHIARLADVEGVVGAAEDVDVVHGSTTMASSLGRGEALRPAVARHERAYPSTRTQGVLAQGFAGSPEARRWASRMVEAAGVEPASEGASSQDSTCVSALEISLAGSKSDEKNLTASPGMSRPHTPRRHVGASPLNGASSPVEGALG